MKPERISAAEARRIAVRAQGFGARPESVSAARLRAMISHLGAVQIDSVNVLVRAQYMPAFSRFGPYDRALLDRVLYARPRRFFEYWGHEASFLPVEYFALMRWRMRRAGSGVGIWNNVARVGREQRDLVRKVRSAIAERGPMAASDFDDAKSVESWWGWSDTKRAVEFLFWCGELSVLRRKPSFERVYDLTERVLPAAALRTHISEDEAFDRLIERAAIAYGVATENELRYYFRIPLEPARAAIVRLKERGVLRPVAVQGWKQKAVMHADAIVPRAARATALVSPFDSLVWNRERVHRVFDFHYRIEIYTPAHKRVHGYYVLPFLFEGSLAARVDLKADRASCVLRVQSVHYEDGVRMREVKPELAAQLRSMAEWLGLERVRLPR